MPVSFGVHTGQQNLSMDDLRAHWREMDDAGMDWISVWDHFYESPPIDEMGPHFEAIAAMATLAAETKNVRVGVLVLCTLYRNPALLAKAIATLDHISHGRVEFGLGAGWHDVEAKAYGFDFPALGERFDIMEEAIQIVRGMLSQERTTFEGKHFTVLNATCQPPPLQSPVPLWIGGLGEKRTLRLAARYADGWNAPYVTPQEFVRLSGILDDWCEKEDRDPATIQRTVNLAFNIGHDEQSAAKIAEGVRATLGPLADRMMGGVLTGTTDGLVDRLAAYIDAGADGLNIALRAPWDAQALHTYANDIVPVLRLRTP